MLYCFIVVDGGDGDCGGVLVVVTIVTTLGDTLVDVGAIPLTLFRCPLFNYPSLSDYMCFLLVRPVCRR